MVSLVILIGICTDTTFFISRKEIKVFFLYPVILPKSLINSKHFRITATKNKDNFVSSYSFTGCLVF